MAVSFQIQSTFPVSSRELFKSWLDSDKHSKMTGGDAQCSDKEGETFNAWNGYIQGKNLKIEEGKEIIQSWRTVQFIEKDPDSLLSLQFEDISDGCRLTLTHKHIPDGQPDYKQGWVDNYFNPMKDFFQS